jgi:glutamine synthetase
MEIKSVLDQVQKDNVKFISLQFTDLLGVIKEVLIPVRELEGALTDGVWFDGSSIEGFARIQESDLFLKPDVLTYALVPWTANEGQTARFICDIYDISGKPFESDPRFVLKKALKQANDLGYVYKVGPEAEFYLFRRDFKSKIQPIDTGGYFDLSSSEGYSVMKEVVAALKNFGINVETSHHEVGKGQYEIDFTYGPALEVADKLLTFKYVVKKIAYLNGVYATFMPKPIRGAAGSGMHVHQSLFSIATGENLFADNVDRYRLSEMAKQFIAGQMANIKGITAVICPTVNSYKRLISGFEAPVYITWAGSNRSALIRVPRWFEGKNKAARIELRCPDPSANPYLAFSVMLRAGLEGIQKGFLIPEPVEENVYDFEGEVLRARNIETLPGSLLEAIKHLEKNALVKEIFGEKLFKKYLEVKQQEWDEFKTQVSSWEIEKYLETY